MKTPDDDAEYYDLADMPSAQVQEALRRLAAEAVAAGMEDGYADAMRLDEAGEDVTGRKWQGRRYDDNDQDQQDQNKV
jgi:hypothetical protein